MLAIALVLSVVGLALGPLLVALGREHAGTAAAVEGLTLGMVPLLIVLRLLPHAAATLHVFAAVLFCLGYLVLWSADRYGHRAGARIEQAVVVPALALHALTDGAALAVATATSARGQGGSAGIALAAALLAHRVPEGLFLATTLVPELGWQRSLRALGLVAAATVVGGVAGGALLQRIPDALLDGLVAFGIGAMLRLVLHSHGPTNTSQRARTASGAGFVVGIAVALALPAPESVLRRAQPSELSVMASLGPIFLASAPYAVVGIGLVVALRAVSDGRADGPGRSLMMCADPASVGLSPASPLSDVVGSPLRLLFAGLGLDTLLLAVRLLGWPVAFWRVAGALLVIAFAGLALRFHRHVRETKGPAPQVDPAPRSRLHRAVALFDHAAFAYVVGLLVACAIEASSPSAIATRVPVGWVLAAAPVVGALFPWCTHAAIPVAAVAIHKGVSPGAAVAFLCAGPVLRAYVPRSVLRAAGARAMVTIVIGTATIAGVVGWVADRFVAASVVPSMHSLLASEHGAFQWAGAGLFACAALVRVAQRGVRAGGSGTNAVAVGDVPRASFSPPS